MGWKTPGYHFLITPDGVAHNLVPIEEVSNGVAGHNHDSLHISYIGGVGDGVNDADGNGVVDIRGAAVDNRTAAQRKTMAELVEKYSAMFPEAVILGHRDFSIDKNRNGIIEPAEWMKTCPAFSVKSWLNEIGYKSKIPVTMLKTLAVVNIREGAGTGFKTLMPPLAKGTVVRKIAQTERWTYVQHNDILGWVMSIYLDKV